VARSTDHAIVWRWDSTEPFGVTPANDNPSALGVYTFNLRFPGQVYDRETTGLYNHHRDYGAWVGRYMQSDPIGLAGGVNTYSYVGGNPLMYVDPTGEFLVGAGAGAAIELGIQAFNNYRNGCDVFSARNYNWYDVGVAAAVGAIAPGWLSVGKTAATSGRAISTLTEQLGRAQTANRVAKIESRIASHSMSIANVLVPQLGFQGVKAIGNQVNNAGGANDCTCRK
jgi:RHS repeat-associated protein